MQKARLVTESIPRVVDAAVLPNYEWSQPRWLDVCFPDALERNEPVTADNPPRMLFVLTGGPERDALQLPTEPGLGHWSLLPDAHVLAPWAIDDATDRLFELRVRAEDVFVLATDSVRGLFWGLHDWAHFHSQGPFERIAETELQCDVAALSWLWRNRELVGVTEPAWQCVFASVRGLWAERFRAEAREFDERTVIERITTQTGAREFAQPHDGRG